MQAASVGAKRPRWPGCARHGGGSAVAARAGPPAPAGLRLDLGPCSAYHGGVSGRQPPSLFGRRPGDRGIRAATAAVRALAERPAKTAERRQ